MRIMAQMSMVMNLDKCIGCHTCSVTCKQAWTNRTGLEYVWFNNVETRPGLGYPRTYEDQDTWKGGWTLGRNGRLKLKGGGRFHKLATIFSNPKLPEISDYYEPWTYDYETLLNAPAQKHFPVARPHSLLSGKPMNPQWGANWDDDLGGTYATGKDDPMLRGIADKVKFEFEQTFMFYLPRICEHCLNPTCAASCPSGAIYKRSEDGIVLVDQNRCRGWRMCISGCPYKKIYFNHNTGKAEKCTFCYPRVEVGIPTVCSETCVGRLRYIGLMLYDADAVLAAASEPDEKKLYDAQRAVFLDPRDPAVASEALAHGIPADWIDAARRSPVLRLIKDYEVALPLHPEYRTMPMVWYIPPLSPIADALKDSGHDAEDAGNLFGAIDALRIPIEYLANLFTAGDVAPVRRVLDKLAAMRSYMRDVNLGRPEREEIAASVGMSGQAVKDMFRLLAIAKYDERYVIPTAHVEQAHALEELATDCPVGGGGSGAFGGGSGEPVPVALQTLAETKARMQADDMSQVPGSVSYLAWDGKGMPGKATPDEVAERRGIPDDHLSNVPMGAARDLSVGGGADEAGSDGVLDTRPPDQGWDAMKLLAALTGRERPTRTPSPTLPEPAIRTAWQAISLLLDHPATAFAHLGALSDAVATLPDGVREPLMRLVAHLAASDPVQVERDYVATFDVTRKCALHLTYYAFGDTRKRGIALVQFKQAYRRGGLEVTEAELPDHLCVLLEFGATIPEVRASAGDPRGASEASLEGPEGTFPIAWKLLNDHRAGVELLHLALEERRSPWTDAVTALRATLPALTGTQAEAVARLLAEGPPDEEVGMDAYALDPRLNPHPAADAELEGSYA